MRQFITIAALLIVGAAWTFPASAQQVSNVLPPWQEGYLDIHYINTGKGNSSFIVFPDGTTLLVDAGEMNIKEFNELQFPIKADTLHLSDTTFSAGAYIAQYIKLAMPRGQAPGIDYALITHFHQDHYGKVGDATPTAPNGAYKLTGITALATLIPIKKLIDRGYPAYNYPVDLRTYYKDRTFKNYLTFLNYETTMQGMKAEALVPGSSQQIQLLHHTAQYPSFQVRNIKTNGTIWKGTGTDTTVIFPAHDFLNSKHKFDENPLSLALKISYGAFDYYTGGDNCGITDTLYDKLDVETPMAKVVGPVEAMSLDHHGNRDAGNDFFLQTLAPQVVIAQTWCSDHIGQELAFRLTKSTAAHSAPDVFTTYMHEEAKVYLGPRVTKGFKSMEGNILIRVMPGGHAYYVLVLDDNNITTLTILKQFGPYQAR